MPRKTPTKRAATTTSRKTTQKKTTKKKTAKPAARKTTKKTPTTTTRGKAATISRAKSPTPKATRKTTRTSASAKQTTATHDPSTDILARAEADITAAIDTLNQRMTQAMTTLTELAVAQHGPSSAVQHTAPVDRAMATFQRLIGEVVDDQIATMLPPLIGLRNEFAGRGEEENSEDDFVQRGLETLDQVLQGADVKPFHPREGDTFDPLIHLAVGEVNRDDMPDGAVVQTFQPGFKSARGKVLQAARVQVNRR